MKDLKILRGMLAVAFLFLAVNRAYALMPFYAGARALGMGGANTALGFESTAVYWNPALLGDIGKSDLTGSFTRDAFDTAYSFVAYGRPVRDWGGIGAGWAHTENSFEKTDIWGRGSGSDNISSNAFMAGFGYYRELPVAFGATVKYVDERIGNFALSGAGVDGGMLFDMQPLRFALVWENMLATGLSGTSVTGSRVTEIMPSNLRLGMAIYGQQAGGLFRSRNGQRTASREGAGFAYTVETDVRIPLDERQKVTVSPGVEGWIDSCVGIRAGVREMRDYTAGLSLWVSGVRFDYAFILSGTLENGHVFSTSFFF